MSDMHAHGGNGRHDARERHAPTALKNEDLAKGLVNWALVESPYHLRTSLARINSELARPCCYQSC